MPDPVLEIHDLAKAFGGVAAVAGVTTALAPGEIRGLIGPNGSGKTTLLNLIGGQVRPDRGRVVLGGRRAGGLTPDALAALGLARTFQVPRVFPRMTVFDNLMVPVCADHRRTPWAGGAREARDLLRLVRLDALAGAEARTLSGGQAMLLQLVRCLIQQPLSLCLLDEPFAGVHPALKDVMVETIREINRTRRVTFLIVSHELATLRLLAPRVLVMHNGAQIAEGALEEVARDPHVIEAYLGRPAARPGPAAGADE